MVEEVGFETTGLVSRLTTARCGFDRIRLSTCGNDTLS
jgi:hypothetical protein